MLFRSHGHQNRDAFGTPKMVHSFGFTCVVTNSARLFSWRSTFLSASRFPLRSQGSVLLYRGAKRSLLARRSFEMFLLFFGDRKEAPLPCTSSYSGPKIRAKKWSPFFFTAGSRSTKTWKRGCTFFGLLVPKSGLSTRASETGSEIRAQTWFPDS